MALIDVKYVHLHAPLFLGGKNHKDKLEAKDGVELKFDEDKDRLWITYNGVTTKVPMTTVHNYSEGKYEPKAPPAKFHAEQLNISGTAQVSTPHGHVFQGLGAGKSR